MPQVSLDEVWDNILKMWDTDALTTTNISVEQSANITGVNASFPSFATPPMGVGDATYELDAFGGLNTTLGANTNTGFQRIMKSNAGVGDICNTVFIVYASSYTVRSFLDSTSVYKNGSLVSTITSARGTLALNSLVIGDRISFNKPCVIYQPTNPGTQGAYAGYAGYAFAARLDRYTRFFRIFNLSQRTANYEIRKTPTSNTNITSTNTVASGTITSGGFVNPLAAGTNATANYFILSDQLICAYFGNPPTQDSVMLYPLSMDVKYGWYSANGHTFAVNNAFVNRTNTGGGNTIAARRADGSTGNVITGLNSGRDNVFGQDGVGGTLDGGTYFSGDPCAVYSDATSGEGVLFTAESQADGSGGEMTSFTSAAAHGRATVSGGGAAWVAFVTAGFSGSEAEAGNYTDVIMRFNSGGTFQDARSFTGQNSNDPYISKAYWGNGSGTSQYASAGDFFYSTVRVQGYQDTDATDKDESNMIMSNEINLPEPTAYNISTAGYESTSAACSEGVIGNDVYSPSTSIAVGAVLFADSQFNTPHNGLTLYWRYLIGRSAYYIQIDYNGIVLAFSTC